jgi:hypothetical protein
MIVRMLAAGAAAVAWASAVAQFDVSLDLLSEQEIIAVGRVADSEPNVVELETLSADGQVAGSSREYRVFELRNVAAIKGSVPKSIKVLKYVSPVWLRPAGATGGFSGIHPEPLPKGKWVLLFLQKAEGGRFAEDITDADWSRRYLAAPPGVEYAMYNQNVDADVLYGDNPPAALRHDYVAFDVYRVLAPYVAEAGLVFAGARWVRTRLSPTVKQLAIAVSYPDVMGPDARRFFVTEIQPILEAPPEDANPRATLERLLTLGSWGDPWAAEQISAFVLKEANVGGDPLKEDLLNAMAHAVRSLRRMYWGDEEAAKLLSALSPKIRCAAIQALATPGMRAAYRDAIAELLFDDDEDVLRQAMSALSIMDEDREHAPLTSPDAGFEEGSHNAEMLEYWRNKQP